MIWQAALAIFIVGAIGFVLVVLPACIVSGRISDSEEQQDIEA